MSKIWRKYYWLIGVFCFLLYIGTSTRLAYSRYQWPNTDIVIDSLRPYVYMNTGQNLAEDKNVICYYFKNEVNPDNWSDLYYFQYTNKSQRQLLMLPAYEAAIQNGYFNVIELSDAAKPALAESLAKEIQSSKKYDLVATIPYIDFGLKGHFQIWTRHKEPKVEIEKKKQPVFFDVRGKNRQYIGYTILERVRDNPRKYS